MARRRLWAACHVMLIGATACSLRSLDYLNPSSVESAIPSDTGAGASDSADAADDPDGSAEACTPSVDPLHLTDAVAIRAFSAHTCALRRGGKIACWGSNQSGETGTSAANNPVTSPTTVEVPGTPSALALGGDHGCSLDAAGAVWCWGSGAYGQLGSTVPEGDFSPHPTPRRISAGGGDPFAGTTPVVAGDGFVCSRGGAGTAWCWGLSDHGQSGTIGTAASHGVPFEGLGTSGATALGAGSFHACAATATGVVCWGENASGQLGVKPEDVPICPPASPCSAKAVAALLPSSFGAPAATIAASVDSTCALDRLGMVICWGGSSYGQTGDVRFSTIAVAPDVPHVVTGLPATGGIAMGGNTTCAVARDGRVRCFGANAGGLLGTDGAPAVLGSPALIDGITDATSVAVGNAHACAITNCGLVVCWGANDKGQLGDGTTTARAIPAPVKAPQ